MSTPTSIKRTPRAYAAAEVPSVDFGSASGTVTALPFDRVERAPRFTRRPPRETIQRASLAIADIACATVTLAVVRLAFGSNPIAPAFAGAILVVALCKLAGLYDADELRLAPSTLDEIPTLLKLSGLFALGIAITTPILTGAQVKGVEVGAVWITLFVALIGGRVLARWFAERACPVERCLVVGDRRQTERIRERLDAERARAIVVGALPITGVELATIVSSEGQRVIQDLVDELHVDRIIVSLDDGIDKEVSELIRLVRATGVRASVVPKTLTGIGSRFAHDEVNGLCLMGVGPFGLSPTSRLLKRSFDLTAGVLALCVTAPVMCLIAIAIKLDSAGPVFFTQIRVGRDGKRFRMIKFRSMVSGADDLKDNLRALSEVGEGMFKIAQDPRVTRIGRALRRTSLDELPQLLNVLRGEMSLVGPRPLVVDEDAAILGVDRSRLHLAPGITGPWQVLRRRVSREDMIEIDYRYAAGWTLWSDVRILLRTVLHVLRLGNH